MDNGAGRPMGRPLSQETRERPVASSLRLLTWNLHATPFSRGNTARVQRASRAIADRQPDAVLLQELWRHDDVRRIRSELGSAYDVTEVAPAGRLYRRSGLLALVRHASAWTVEQSTFHEFQSEAGDWKIWEGDGLGDKGVQALVLARGPARVGILNTHLQSAYSRGRYALVRAQQIVEFNGVGASLANTIPVIAGGDFNTLPDESAFALLRNTWIDLTEDYRRQCRCGTHYLPGGSEGGWIDHLLARSDRSWQIGADSVSLLRNTAIDDPYSDHHALMAELTIRPTGFLLNPEAVAALLVSPTRLTRRQWLHACIRSTRRSQS